MSKPTEPLIPPASRRVFLGQAAASALVGAAAATPAMAAGTADYTAEEIAARDAANVAASHRRKMTAVTRYAPLDAGIVHIFGYGQSLSNGWYGVPVLSNTQPYDNLMIGEQTRATSNNSTPPISTTWVPVGPTGSNGVYPFNPMIATPASENVQTAGETPGEGALNFFRRAYLRQLGLRANPKCRFVLTDCGIGGQDIAALSKGAPIPIYNRLLDAANYVKQTATSLGLTYQVGAMIWTQGEQDVTKLTPYATYLAALQQLQANFLTDVVQGIAGQPAGTVVPWFCHQPDFNTYHRTTAVYQALLDWSNTTNSDLYLAGPVYQYPDHSVHLTANGYRWHANQVGKAMTNVLLNGQTPRALYVTSATFRATTILANVNVPVPPLMQGDAYVLYNKTVFPNLGFIVTDSHGTVPVQSVTISGQATIKIKLGRPLQSAPVLQSGWTVTQNEDWGTNICDSDATVAHDPYVYVVGVQDPGEDIATWNGAPLIGQPYPLNNYLAVGQVAITPG